MKIFTSVNDVSNIDELVQSAIQLKKSPFSSDTLGRNKTLGIIFFNPSLRTTLSTQKAAINLGLSIIVMNIDKQGWAIETQEGAVMDKGKAVHIREAAAVVGQYCDIIGVRAFATLENRDADYLFCANWCFCIDRWYRRRTQRICR